MNIQLSNDKILSVYDGTFRGITVSICDEENCIKLTPEEYWEILNNQIKIKKELYKLLKQQKEDQRVYDATGYSEQAWKLNPRKEV